MGQTLTHGIYLPDEGERNCYDGLAANWQLLDGAVGTVAEHTSQIAGKAPAVHTHTKSDITDFPVYGTTAGTICEGNDSRLSDARTPVAHTHTKSEITDFPTNVSAFTNDSGYANDSGVVHKSGNETIGGNKSFTGMMILNSASDVAEQFRQKLPHDPSVYSNAQARFNTLVDSEGHNVAVEAIGHWDTYVSKSIALKYKNDKQGVIDFRVASNGTGLLYPQSPFECTLGNSSNRWKSVYSDSYYYGTTAWGLDKANVWSSWQTIERTNSESLLRLRRTDIKIGDSIPANQINVGSLGFADSDDFNLGLITCRDETNGNTRLVLATRQKYDSNGNRSNSGTTYESRVDIGITGSGVLYLRPYIDNSVNLGTSTNKWKSLNGINPGALSLPDKPGGSGTVNVNYFDLSGNVTIKDGSTYNSYTALCDGWIVIGSFASEISIEDDTTNLATTAVPKSNGYAQAYLPVRQGDTVRITINQTNTQYQNFKLIPCQGNV